MTIMLISAIFAFTVPSQAQFLQLVKGEYKKFQIQSMPQVPHAYDALHYDFDITVDVNGDTIIAKTTATCVSLSDTLSVYKVHLIGLTVDSTRVNGVQASFVRQDSSIYIDLGTNVPAGDTFQTEIFYHGHPQIGGGVFGGGLSISPTLIYADNEPFGIKRWLPILDDPNEKATIDFYLTVPSGFKLVANGTLIDSSLSGSQWFYHWQESYPISPYLIVFAASPTYAVWEETYTYGNYTMPLITAVYDYDSLLAVQKFVNLPDMITYFSDEFALYPFINEKYGHVHAPIGGAMENQTNTFINMHAGWGQDWDWVVSHELAHQWWGDWVTLGDWRDIWLNEGFATYCEALWAGHREDPEAYRTFMDNIMNYAVIHEPYPPYPVYDPQNLFSGAIVYYKGASVLHMLRHVVGDSAFFQSLREYGQTYAYGNAITEDLRAIFESVSGMNLEWFFQEWIYEPGHPEYHWGWENVSSGNNYGIFLAISQVQSHAYGVPTFKMPIDIKITTTTGDTTVVVWDSLDYQEFYLSLNSQPLNVEFDPYPWIMKEATQTSVHEVTPPVNSDKFIILHPTINRLTWIGTLPRNTRFFFYNTAGQKIYELYNPRKGTYLDFPSGLYLLNIQLPDGKFIKRKFVIIKD